MRAKLGQQPGMCQQFVLQVFFQFVDLRFKRVVQKDSPCHAMNYVIKDIWIQGH